MVLQQGVTAAVMITHSNKTQSLSLNRLILPSGQVFGKAIWQLGICSTLPSKSNEVKR
jgi:hypothetical protein